jgi:YD repeat-containing protein
MTRITDHKAGITYTCAYDALHRLVSEHNTAASETYAGIDLVFEYAAYSRPLHAPDQVVSQQTSYDYDYDDNGNMTEMADFSRPNQAAVRTVVYNADNMPLQIVHALGATVVTTDLFYDGQGRRVEKTVGAGGSTYYIGAHFEVEAGVEVKYIEILGM